MKGIKRWTAALLCVLMLSDTGSVLAAQTSRTEGVPDRGQAIEEAGILDAATEAPDEEEPGIGEDPSDEEPGIGEDPSDEEQGIYQVCRREWRGRYYVL